MNHDDVTRGIQNEKTRESLAVMMAIAAVLLALVIGNLSSVGIGVVIMLGLFGLIWRYYSAPRRR